MGQMGFLDIAIRHAMLNAEPARWRGSMRWFRGKTSGRASKRHFDELTGDATSQPCALLIF